MKFLSIFLLILVSKVHAGEQITHDEIIPSGSSLSDFSVKKWGAVGDGETDDYPSINKAIEEQAPYGKVILYFPPGKYKVSQSIKISGAKNNTYSKLKFLIEGAGNDKTEVFVIDKNQDTFNIESGDDEKFIQGLLSNMFIGPKRDQKDKSWAVNVKNLERSKISDITTKGSQCSIRTIKSGRANIYGGAFPIDKEDGMHRSACLTFQ